MMKCTCGLRWLCGFASIWLGLSGMAAMPAETSPTGIDMVRLPGGTFRPGPPSATADPVELAPFRIALTPVTQEQFEQVMGANPSRWVVPDHPVERVTWKGAALFCNRLSRLEGLQPVYDEEDWTANPAANGYRLPTEAEWEYAARGGSDTAYFWGEDPRRLRFFAWYRGNAEQRTRPVRRKMPNPFGLFDMYGNVWEWCADDIAGDGPSMKVVRGGSWNAPPEECSSFFRGKAEPGYDDICTAAYDVYGFRVVRHAR